MEYRQFWQTGLQVSAIGFGGWEMGGGYGAIGESEMIAAIHRAMDVGINCFDTAEGYGMGRSESLVGRGAGESAQRCHYRHKIRYSLRKAIVTVRRLSWKLSEPFM